MATYRSLPNIFFVTCLIFGISFTEAINGGISVELIHRDSPKSPFFNPTETPFQQVANAFHRSFNRANHFYPTAVASTDQAESEIISANGEYIMSYSMGTPPFKIFGIADTGSDLIWSQCNPCDECYNQRAPLFDPSKSTTYKTIPCSSKQCQSVDRTSCKSTGDQSNICEYDALYGDRSFSRGDLALDTLTLDSTNGRPVTIPKIIFGCGHNNDGTFNDQTSGIVGLGGGAVSLISQMSSSVDGKFSYCLVPFFSDSKNSSKLNFGENAVVSGSGTVSTPMVSKAPDTFYYLTLEGMSVGAKRLEFAGDSSSDQVEGNIIIDSGTTLTLLPQEFYSKLESEVAAQIKLERLVQDPDQTLSLCYKSISQSIEAPIITVHFAGADVKLNPLNTFVKASEDVVCFAFSSISNGAIFGNLAQMNFLVGYDLQNKVLSFKPTDCTQL